MCFVASAADTRVAARAAGRAEPRAARACQTKGREGDYKLRIGELWQKKERHVIAGPNWLEIWPSVG